MIIMLPQDNDDFEAGDLSSGADDTGALNFTQETPPDGSKTFVELGDLFPCLLMLCGTNGAAFLVRI